MTDPYIPEAHHLRLPTEAELAAERRDAALAGAMVLLVIVSLFGLTFLAGYYFGRGGW